MEPASTPCEPAATILSKLGGPSVVSRYLGIHRTRCSNWKRPRDVGGTGGQVPQRYHPKLLELAKKLEVEMSAEHFLPPAPPTAPDAPADHEPAGASS